MTPPRLLFRALAGLAMALATAGAAVAAPPLWAVRDEDSTIYLFGTMHVLTDDADWRTPTFDKAMAESGEIWFEVDVETDPRIVAPLMQQFGFDLKTPLSKKVSPETMAALREALKTLPGGTDAVEHMQPWTAAMMVQMLPMFEGGFDARDGADVTLSRDAHRADQRVRYFETIEQQLRFFADLPQAVQIQFLEDSLGGAQTGEEAMASMQTAWIDGDVQLFGSALVVAMRDETPELYDALIRRRNRAWVDVLEREMAGKGTSMVNVGALHMVGEDGLVTQLRARGFVVERVQ